MSNFGQSTPAEACAPNVTITPNSRRQIERFYRLAHKDAIPAALNIAWGTLDIGATPVAGWSSVCRLIGRKVTDQVGPKGKDTDPILVLTFEEIDATAETLITGGDAIAKAEDGSSVYTADAIQFSTNTFVPGTVGTLRGTGNGGYLRNVEHADDGTLHRIKRTYIISGIIATDDESLQGGALLKKTITSVMSVPATPSGFTLVGSPVQNPNGLPIYSYTFYKGAGLVLDSTALRNSGALRLYNRTALGAAPTAPTARVINNVASIAVTNGGSGYTSVPTVAITGGGGTGATAVAVLSGGAVASVTLASAGTGYITAPSLAITGGGGSGASGTVALTPTSVASATISAGGSGYTSPPAVTPSGGGGSGAAMTAALTPTGLASIAVSAAGGGYTSPPTVAITGGGGTGATATALLSPSGQIIGITLTAGGSGYTSAPTITLSGGGGAGATATCALNSRGVASITVLAGGSYPSSVTSFASGLGQPEALAFDSAGNLFVSDATNNKIWKVTPSGSVSTFATGMDGPEGIAFDASGNLFVSNFNTGVIKKITPLGVVTDSDGLGNAALAFDSSGNLYSADYNNGTVDKITPSGVSTTFASGFSLPNALAFDPSGNLYVAGWGSADIFKVTPGGTVSTLATGFSQPTDLTTDSSGNVYVTNWGVGGVNKITPGGVVSLYADGFPNGQVLALAFKSGILYVSNSGGTVSKFGPATAPTVILSGGGGSGATAVAVLSGTTISGFTITAAGTGYTSAPAVTLNGSGGGSGTAVLSTAAISGFTVTAAGSGYTSAPTVGLAGGSGSGASGTAIVSTGSVIGFSMTTAGGGYTSTPSVSLSGGGGSGAAGLGTLVGTSIASITLASSGGGYTSAPLLTISGGGGGFASGAVALVATTLAAITLVSGGTGYNSPPTLTLIGGGGTGGAASATLSPSTVSAVTMTVFGSGYTSTPTVGFSGGSGSGATGLATVFTDASTVGLVSSLIRKESGFDVYEYAWAEALGIISIEDEIRTGGKLLLRTIRTVGTVPTTPAGYTVVSTDTQEQDGYTLYTYRFAKGSGEISRRTSQDNGGALTRVSIRHLTEIGASQPTTDPLAGGMLVESEPTTQDGYLLWSVTWVIGAGEISRKTGYSQSNNQGATGATTLTIRYLSPLATTGNPIATPGGMVLVDVDQSAQDGYRIWTAVYAKGTGTVVSKNSQSNGGKLITYTLVALGAAAAAPAATIGGTVVLVDSDQRKEAGFDVFTSTYVEGLGEISRRTGYSQSNDQGATGATTLTIRCLSELTSTSNPITKPSGTVLVDEDYSDQAGYRIWTAVYAKGTGTVVSKNSQSNGGKLITYTRVALGAAAAAPAATIAGTVVLIDSDQRKEAGFDVFTSTYAEGLGVIRRFLQPREGGLRLETWVSLGTAYDAGYMLPPGVLMLKDYDLGEGVTRWTVTAMQSATGGDPAAAPALSIGTKHPFTYPGRAKAFTTSFAAVGFTAYAHDLFLSPPIEILVDATIEVSYQTSASIGALANPLWNPDSWATVRAFWEGWNENAQSLVKQFSQFRAVGSPVTFTAGTGYASGFDTSCMGNKVYGGSSGSITVSGGPAAPDGNTYTLAASLDPSPAFTSEAGVHYYRKTVISAAIPTQTALPV
jgi:sugar lactone lactonase YvrE